MYQKKCQKEGLFAEAARSKRAIEQLKDNENSKQEGIMRSGQENELLAVEKA
jgi:hypothetical protein